MHLTEGGKPIGVVTAEEEVDVLVRVESQELAYDLDGEDLRIGELGGGSAASEAQPLDSVVYEAKDGHDEGAKIHERRPPLRRSVWSLPSVGRSSLLLKPSKKLAHGVS